MGSGVVSIGVTMGVLYERPGIRITDEWLRCQVGTYAIRDLRSAWVTRRQVTRGSRLLTAGLGVGALLVLIGGAGLSGWLTRNWTWLLFSPVLFFVAASIGLLDPVAIYLEKRHHELWIQTDTQAVRVWKANKIEVTRRCVNCNGPANAIARSTRSSRPARSRGRAGSATPVRA